MKQLLSYIISFLFPYRKLRTEFNDLTSLIDLLRFTRIAVQEAMDKGHPIKYMGSYEYGKGTELCFGDCCLLRLGYSSRYVIYHNKVIEAKFWTISNAMHGMVEDDYVSFSKSYREGPIAFLDEFITYLEGVESYN